jgi:hypothetical protein
MLALTEESEFGWLNLPDGRRVAFYSLYPLYTEERDLEKKKGTKHVVELFQKYKISKVVNVERLNVAKAERDGPGKK